MLLLKKFYAEEDGQDMVEYGLVLAAVVAVGVVVFGAFSNTLSNAFTTIETAITSAL